MSCVTDTRESESHPHGNCTMQANQREPLSSMKKDRQKEYKSYAERMRRNRINGCLKELKLTILGTAFQNIKMEQAKVLELTVEYIKLVKSQCLSSNEEFTKSASCQPLRCHTPSEESLHGRKRKNIENPLECAADLLPKSRKIRRKLKGKKLEFSQKSFVPTTTQSGGVINSMSSTRRPLENLRNINNEKPCTFWRPW